MFRKAVGMHEATRLRGPGIRDIVRRLGMLSRERVIIDGYPLRNPVTIFNASVTVCGACERETLVLYARIVAGYYKYVSAMNVLYGDAYLGDRGDVLAVPGDNPRV